VIKYAEERVIVEVVNIGDGWLVDPGLDRLANFWGRSIHPKLSTCIVGRYASDAKRVWP